MTRLIPLALFALSIGCTGSAILGEEPPSPPAATDDDDVAGTTCAEAEVSFDFTDGRQEFDHDETDGTFLDPWEFGAPTEQECATGERCWATNTRDDYGDCNAGRMFSPPIDLSACADATETVTLSFMHYYDFEEPSRDRVWDGGLLQIGVDGDWADTDPRPGYDGELDGNFSECDGTHEANGHEAWSGAMPVDGWQRVEVVLAAEFLTEATQIGFLFGSDRAAVGEGWYVDDVAISID